MEPLKTSLSRLVMIGLTSKTHSAQELRTLADWTFQRRLLAVRHVAQVQIFGGDIKQYQVLVNPEQLRRYKVTLADVVAAAQNPTAIRGAGFIDTANQRLPIGQRTDLASTTDLAAAPVALRNACRSRSVMSPTSGSASPYLAAPSLTSAWRVCSSSTGSPRPILSPLRRISIIT